MPKLRPDRLAALTATCLLFLTMTASAQWEQLSPLPEPNGGFALGAVGHELILAGGTNWEGGTKNWLSVVRVFDTRSKTWRKAASLPEPLAYAAAAGTPAGLLLAGGSSGTHTHAQVSLLSAAGESRPLTAFPSAPVYAGGALLGGRFYLIGGAPAQDQPSALTSACFALDPATGASRRLADLPGPPRLLPAVAASATGHLLIFAGAEWDAAAGAVANLATAFRYDPAADQWSPLPPLPQANRGIAAVTLDDGRIYLAGGYTTDDEGFVATAYLFDPATGQYRPGPALPYASFVHLVVCEGYLYCLGGEDKKQHRTDAAWRLPMSALR